MKKKPWIWKTTRRIYGGSWGENREVRNDVIISKKKTIKQLSAHHAIKPSLSHLSLDHCPQTQGSVTSSLVSLKLRRCGASLRKGLGSHFRYKSTFPFSWWMFILVSKVELNFPLNVCLELRFDWQGEMGLFQTWVRSVAKRRDVCGQGQPPLGNHGQAVTEWQVTAPLICLRIPAKPACSLL